MAGTTDFTFGLLNTSGPNIEEKCDCTPVVLPYSDQGVELLSSGIVVGNAFLEENPEAVERFLAALVESIEWVNGNEQEALDAFFRFASSSTLPESTVARQWEISSELETTPATKGQPLGCMAQSDWESTISLMEQFGDVPAGAVAVDDIATNAFLPGDCRDTLGAP